MVWMRVRVRHTRLIGCAELLRTVTAIAVALGPLVVISLIPTSASALPLYARQTGQPCATCHTAFLELTPVGRSFKLGGYTLDGGD